MDKKYPDPDKYSKQLKKEYDAFYANNLDKRDAEGKITPKKSIYRNAAFFSLTDAERSVMNEFLDIKRRMDSFLPLNENTNLAVQIRKDLLERLKKSKSIVEGISETKESIKDAFLLKSDDIDQVLEGLTGFGKEAADINFLPIYYRKPLERSKDISMDVASTLKAYSAMAENYSYMHEIIDILEHTRDVISQKKIIKTVGGKPVYEMIGDKQVPIYIDTKKSNIVKRLNGFFEMQVYEQTSKPELIKGTNLSWGKTANQINKLTALNVYAVNFLGGITNITVGKLMMRTEAISGEFFNYKDLLAADTMYAKSLPAFKAQMGKRVQTNKLALFDEKFNVLQNFEKVAKDSKMDRRTRASRLFSMDLTFFLANAGEHYMHNRTALSLANNTYFLDKSTGKKINL